LNTSRHYKTLCLFEKRLSKLEPTHQAFSNRLCTAVIKFMCHAVMGHSELYIDDVQ